MKHFSLLLLILALIATTLSPQATFARGGSGSGSDDDSHYSDDSDDDEDEDDDSDDSDDDSDDRDDDSDDSDSNSSSTLEVEADVFTDTTIVKVEKNDTKTIFETDADTRSEVIDVVVERFNLTKSDVEDVLQFETENRASRAKERAEIGSVHTDDDDRCDDSTSSSTLSVEADVFTNTTIVKVEKSDVTTVFETDANTRSEVIDVVTDRFDLTSSEVETVLDFEVEDRRSRTTDLDTSSSSSSTDDCDDEHDDDGRDNSGPGNMNNSNDAELRAKIAKLQELIQALMTLFTAQFGRSF